MKDDLEPEMDFLLRPGFPPTSKARRGRPHRPPCCLCSLGSGVWEPGTASRRVHPPAQQRRLREHFLVFGVTVVVSFSCNWPVESEECFPGDWVSKVRLLNATPLSGQHTCGLPGASSTAGTHVRGLQRALPAPVPPDRLPQASASSQAQPMFTSRPPGTSGLSAACAHRLRPTHTWRPNKPACPRQPQGAQTARTLPG